MSKTKHQNNPKQKLFLVKSKDCIVNPGKVVSYFVKTYERAQQIFNQRNSKKFFSIAGEKTEYMPFDKAYYYDQDREKIQIYPN